LYTDNESEKKKETDGSFMRGAVFVSDSPFFQSTDLRPPGLNLESEADGQKEKRRGPEQKPQSFKSDIFFSPLEDNITIESHQEQTDEQGFPVPIRETPTIAEESLDAMSDSTTRAADVERREIDKAVLVGEATEEDGMDEAQTIQQLWVAGAASVGTSRDDYSTVAQADENNNLPDQASPGRRMRYEAVPVGEATEEDGMDEAQTIQQLWVAGAASVGTSRDDYSQIEEMVCQAIRDMSAPAATVAQADENIKLPDQASPGRRMRLFGKLVRKFGRI
jgi:hypothetical protein